MRVYYNEIDGGTIRRGGRHPNAVKNHYSGGMLDIAGGTIIARSIPGG